MIQIKQAFNAALNKHNRCPKGVMGRIAGEVMVRQHRPETSWTIRLLDIQPADTVLEVGFGAGQGIKLAAEQVNGGRIIGIDLSEQMVRVATKRNASAVREGRVALSQGNITALPFEDQRFDKIMTIHTLYFWLESHDPSQALSELYRVLKPGGRLVITLSTGKIQCTGRGGGVARTSVSTRVTGNTTYAATRLSCCAFGARSDLPAVHQCSSHW